MDIGDSESGKLESIWAKLDTQSISLESRKLLDANGLRCAILPRQPPSEFWQIIDPADDEESDEVEKDYQQKLRKVKGLPQQKNILAIRHASLQSGKAHRIEVAPVASEMTWHLDLNGNRKSGVCQLAQCKYRITAFPQGNGIIKIRLTPEIHHGKQIPRIQVAPDTFFWEPSQEKMKFHELAVEIPLRVGQTVLCGATAAPGSNLGRQFFRSADSQRVLFVRLAGAQSDDLFSPKTETKPLVTPID